MNWFSEFGSLSWITVAMLAAALAGGILAFVLRKNARRVMIITGIVEMALAAGALIWYLTMKDAEGTVFEDISLRSWVFTLLVALAAAAMLAVLILTGRKEKWTARDLANASVCVALSFLLSCVKLYHMPQGGSITPASMLPLILFIHTFGAARGLAAGFAFGLLQLLQGAYVIHPLQLAVDYPMAYGALALAGFAGKLPLPKMLKLPAAVILGYLGRYLMAVLSGSVFFAEYAGEQNAWLYSILYNLSYLGPDCLVCAAAAAIPGLSRLSERMRAGRF